MFMQPLEARRLMTVSVNVVAGVLLVQGTADNEAIAVNEYVGESGEKLFTVEAVTFDADGGVVEGSEVVQEGIAGVNAVLIDAGGGDDLVIFGNDTTAAVVLGGAGNDSITVSASTQAANPGLVLVLGGSGDDGISVFDRTNVIASGDSGNDILDQSGGDASNMLVGGSGNDTLQITGGAGTIVAGDGVDTITASFAHDVLISAGNDGDQVSVVNSDTVYAYGGNGNDLLVNQGSTNTYLYGENGNDILEAEEWNGVDPTGEVNGGNGNDTLVSDTDSTQIRFDGGNGKDTAIIMTSGGGSVTQFRRTEITQYQA